MRLPRLRRPRATLPARPRDEARVFVDATPEEREQFVALYAQVRDPFTDYAERFLPRDDALDATADTMAILWERWATLEPRLRDDRYAFGILRHRIHAAKRAQRGRVSLDDAELELEVRAARLDEEVALDRELADRDALVAEIREQVLATMPERRREVLTLILEHQLSYRDAGEALDLNKGTIAQHMRLAFQTLRTACHRAGLRGVDALLRRLPSPKGGSINE